MVDTSIVNGIINQLITWGAPPCMISHLLYWVNNGKSPYFRLQAPQNQVTRVNHCHQPEEIVPMLVHEFPPPRIIDSIWGGATRIKS